MKRLAAIVLVLTAAAASPAGEIGTIELPTLVIVGDEDVATPPAKAQKIHEAITGSRLEVIPGAGHTSTLEQPELINAALEAFLAEVDATG